MAASLTSPPIYHQLAVCGTLLLRCEITHFSRFCSFGGLTIKTCTLLHCHCRDCQQSSGGPFSSFVIVPTEAFKLLQGSLRFHASPSQMGGKTHRGFCPECGSPIQAKPDSTPHIVAIRTASLDDPSWFLPRVDNGFPTMQRFEI